MINRSVSSLLMLSPAPVVTHDHEPIAAGVGCLGKLGRLHLR